MQIYLDNEILQIQPNTSLQELVVLSGLNDKVVVLGKVNDEVRPLTYILNENDSVKYITLKDKEGITAYRRTLLLIFAHALKVVYPTCLLADCKVTDTGFYYNVDFKTPIKNQDLQKISDEMKKIIKSDFPITTCELSKKDASKKMKAFKEFYKLQSIVDSDEDKVVFYKEGSFMELYFGQTLSSTGKVKNFKLDKISGAYYLGDKKNNPLTRISAVAFEKKSQIDEYYQNLKESESVAHIKLGKKLGYYTTSQGIGKGLPIILNKGEFIIKTLKRLIEDDESSSGFTWVRTPVIAKTSFYKKRSVTYKNKESLYQLNLGKKDKNNLSLRSNMTAFHLETFASSFKSYKDLPIRYAENSISFNNVENNGVKGLVKTRQFTAYEENIICLERQFKDEISLSIDRILKFTTILGFKDDLIIKLGVKGSKESSKFLASTNEFIEQENLLKNILNEKGLKYTEKVGACTNFGCTLQFLLKNSYRKDDVIISLQLDKELPKLLNLKYTERNGKKCNPVSIHVIGEGGYEKILAYLIEKYKGAMPIWLALTQVQVISVGKSNIHAKEVYETLVNNGFRCIINLKNENINKKIKESQINQIPYTVIVGNKEEKDAITVRKYASNNVNSVNLAEFISLLNQEIKNKF